MLDEINSNHNKDIFVLQNVVFSTKNFSIRKLFYRSNKNRKNIICNSENEYKFIKNETVSLDTYFNVFSKKKYLKYTHLSSLYFCVLFKGDFEITFYKIYRSSNKIYKTPISVFKVSSNFKRQVLIKIIDNFDLSSRSLDEIISVSFTSVAKDSVVYRASFATKKSTISIKKVKLALLMCTFHREEYVKKNIQVVSNINKLLDNKIKLFLIDNGSTLNTNSNDKNVLVFHNSDLGASGGFCRAMIEAINKNNQKDGFSHAVVMDDDITLETESILRTISFLSITKKEYDNLSIAGSMLRMDKPNIQHECGGIWRIYKQIESIHYGLDLSNISNVFKNELEDKNIEFSAWWYSVIPMKYIRLDNLPLPLFMRFDDVEYGLRNKMPTMCLNGICVWHEPFEYKYSPIFDYYHSRNMCIVNASLGISLSRKKLLFLLFKECVHNMINYRYLSSNFICKGMIDFLKGFSYFEKIDMEKHHLALLKKARFYNYKNIDSNTKNYIKHCTNNHAMAKIKKSKLFTIISLITLNGMLLPTKKTICQGPSLSGLKDTFATKKIIIVDSYNNRYFSLNRNLFKLLKSFLYLIITFMFFAFRFKCVYNEFNIKSGQIKNINFWRKKIK